MIMSCSTHYRTFADQWSCDLPNQTTLYCNYPLNCICNATTEADPDIAGPGVISSFIVVAWITLAVAMIPAYFEFLEFLVWAQDQKWPWETPLEHRNRKSLRTLRGSAWRRRALHQDQVFVLRNGASRLLGSLCDLQVITGLGILIAGFAQMPQIAFYHESIIMNAWYLTLDSFFAARVDFMRDDAARYGKRAMIRRGSVFVSVVLGAAFQVRVTIRELNDWDFLLAGRCYLFHDKSSVWWWGGYFWGASSALFAFFLLLSIMPWTQTQADRYTSLLDSFQAGCVKFWTKSGSKLVPLHMSSLRSLQWNSVNLVSATVMHLAIFLFASFIMSLSWLFLQVLDVFTYGNGFYPLQLLFYVGLSIWNTYDIGDLKSSNQSLVDGPETKWGFGQVLPIVLLLTILYNIVDAFAGEELIFCT